MEILLMFGVMMAALLVFSSLGRRKQVRAQEELRASLEPGVEVMTGSGFFGFIVEVTDEYVVLESEPGGARTRWIPAAVTRRVTPIEYDDYEDDADSVPDDPAALIEKYSVDRDDEDDKRN